MIEELFKGGNFFKNESKEGHAGSEVVLSVLKGWNRTTSWMSKGKYAWAVS